MSVRPIKLSFPGASGADLAARLDLPTGHIRAYALFAHCFTCSKDLIGARKISEALTRQGIAVMRFDFTGLGDSGGDFASTNFSTNLADLASAVSFLRDTYKAPAILIGHSLGGRAILSMAADVPEAKAVVTIGSPESPAHVTHQFAEQLDVIRKQGEAAIRLGERPFTIRRQFLDDLEKHSLADISRQQHYALLVMHSPTDTIVGIENATGIFTSARHPKSFVSLDTADHLLSNRKDATYAATVIGGWASHYIDDDESTEEEETETGIVELSETGLGKFQNTVRVGPHKLLADEPLDMGGLGSGPSPYEFLSTALGACTNMTLRMYADHKKIPLDRVAIRVRHFKTHGRDSESAAGDKDAPAAKLDHFEREIALEGDFDDKTRARLLEIADKCPVHKTLETGAKVLTRDVTEAGETDDQGSS
ncbi:bifunctional alpha/beta hydrolase/OsmC family protein [Parvularcula sp. IMCC14364]|uniref:bifunctional alpha/beta hydrolase/OsmC family protein n=1 Tax=Parvularcula sp. IMCC14364 TaxID=3067902 RepID=UPI002740A531|nr:bifunctional alpha/beta hydrolase/OsmC family protein [Parvularcula sp. IMCC14364]